MKNRITITIVEDNAGDAGLVRRMLSSMQEDYAVDHVTTLAAALEILQRGSTDVLLLDLGLPDSSGLQTLARVHAQAPSVPVIVITGLLERDIAVQALNQGARDFIAKERVDARLLEKAILRAVEDLPGKPLPA